MSTIATSDLTKPFATEFVSVRLFVASTHLFASPHYRTANNLLVLRGRLFHAMGFEYATSVLLIVSYMRLVGF